MLVVVSRIASNKAPLPGWEGLGEGGISSLRSNSIATGRIACLVSNGLAVLLPEDCLQYLSHRVAGQGIHEVH
jgi:hypothetical protein